MKNNKVILCEICNKKTPRSNESRYCQECRDWFRS
jgi:hypothetical protein